MTLWLAAVAALALALVSAALLSRRAPGHRPVVALLALGLVVDLTVETIRHALTRPLDAPHEGLDADHGDTPSTCRRNHVQGPTVSPSPSAALRASATASSNVSA